MSTTVAATLLTQVEFGQPEDPPQGTFQQLTARDWAELGATGECRFRFIEVLRDEWSVLLRDDSRNVGIGLDLWRKEVRYQAPGSNEYTSLYPIQTATAAPLGDGFAAVRAFLDWRQSGGEQRAGLPAGSMNALGQLTVDFRSTVRQLAYDLRQTKDIWQQALQSGEDADAAAKMARCLANLAAMESLAGTALNQAVAAGDESQRRMGDVDAHITQDRNAILQAESSLVIARQNQEAARLELEAAKAQLSGNQGFLNGFLTGLTLGIHNPVKENIDKQTVAVARYNLEVANAKNAIALFQQSSSELAEGKAVLSLLAGLSDRLTDFKNLLSTAQATLHEGLLDTEKLARARGALAKYYRSQAGQEMAGLLAWLPSFSALT